MKAFTVTILVIVLAGALGNVGAGVYLYTAEPGRQTAYERSQAALSIARDLEVALRTSSGSAVQGDLVRLQEDTAADASLGPTVELVDATATEALSKSSALPPAQSAIRAFEARESALLAVRCRSLPGCVGGAANRR